MYSFETQSLVSEPIDDIAEALPRHHLHKDIRQVVRYFHIGIGRPDVCQRMGEGLGRRPWHTADG